MKYVVDFTVHGHYRTVVDAESPEEAKTRAEFKFWDANFGDLRDADGEPNWFAELGNRQFFDIAEQEKEYC